MSELHPGNLTKGELARLVRVARAMGYLRVDARTADFYCPVDSEFRRASHDCGLPHRFSVVHQPWEKGTTVTEVRLALENHLRDNDLDGTPCHQGKGVQ